MRGFFIFLLATFLVIGLYVGYKIAYPDDIQMVKSGKNWVPIRRKQ